METIVNVKQAVIVLMEYGKVADVVNLLLESITKKQIGAIEGAINSMKGANKPQQVKKTVPTTRRPGKVLDYHGGNRNMPIIRAKSAGRLCAKCGKKVKPGDLIVKIGPVWWECAKCYAPQAVARIQTKATGTTITNVVPPSPKAIKDVDAVETKANRVISRLMLGPVNQPMLDRFAEDVVKVWRKHYQLNPTVTKKVKKMLDDLEVEEP
jgi:hypothetical protein